MGVGSNIFLINASSGSFTSKSEDVVFVNRQDAVKFDGVRLKDGMRTNFLTEFLRLLEDDEDDDDDDGSEEACLLCLA